MNINNVKLKNYLVPNTSKHANPKFEDFSNAGYSYQKLKIILSTHHLEELLYRDKFILEFSQGIESQDFIITIEKEKSF